LENGFWDQAPESQEAREPVGPQMTRHIKHKVTCKSLPRAGVEAARGKRTDSVSKKSATLQIRENKPESKTPTTLSNDRRRRLRQ